MLDFVFGVVGVAVAVVAQGEFHPLIPLDRHLDVRVEVAGVLVGVACAVLVDALRDVLAFRPLRTANIVLEYGLQLALNRLQIIELPFWAARLIEERAIHLVVGASVPIVDAFVPVVWFVHPNSTLFGVSEVGRRG